MTASQQWGRRIATLSATVGLIWVCSCSRPVDPKTLSVVLVTLDTTRADHIGTYGGRSVPTPNLDRVAREGVRIEEAVSQVPLTLPSHASILTGRYPASHGVRHNGIYRLRDPEETLAERLRAAGFQTAAFIGAYVMNRQYGTGQGFDHYDDITVNRYQGGRDNLYEAQRTADEVNGRISEWLGRRPDGRLFLWIHYYDPHLPYSPPEKPGRALSGTGYDREISYVDACFGDLLGILGRHGLLDRSLLVVVGDHGESLGEHREISHGIFLYDGAVHVPLLIRAPGLVPRGRTVKGPVELVDVAPTILDLLKLEPLPSAQGRSLAERIGGTPPAENARAYAETLMPRIDFGWSELRMVRTGRYKYIQAPRPELYDLKDDPRETKNLLADQPAIAEDMASRLSEWVGFTENQGATEGSKKALTSEEEAMLRSLGYLGGGPTEVASSGAIGLPDPKDRIEEGMLLTQARDLLAAGHAEEALRVFDVLIRRHPTNHLARTSRLQALVRLRRLEEAEDEARAAVDAAVGDAAASNVLQEKARRALASVLWMRGKAREAEREYRLALELNRVNESAPLFGGILLGAAGGWEEAMRIVHDVLQRNPRDGMAMAARFELELARGDQDGAYRTAGALAELRSGDADTLLKAGKLARDRGDAALAARLFEIANGRKPNDPDILGYLGTARLAMGDLAGAENALTRSNRLRPGDPRAPFYLGNIALLRNEEAHARQLYDEALRLDPKFTSPLLNLARWLAEKGRREEARAALDEAVRRNPGDEEVRRLLKDMSGTPVRVPGASG